MPNPKLIATPFAETGTRNDIPESGASEPQFATMQAGFPSITQQPLPVGIPPERADFNGAFHLTTSHLSFLNKGNWYGFDETFAGQIGGYSKNARLQLDNGDIVKSTIDANTNNPNNNMLGWVADSSQKIVSSVSELSSMAGSNGDYCLLTGYRNNGSRNGYGEFIYDSSMSNVNDGGNVFNGWVRQVPSNYLNLQNFGATSSGLQDYSDQEALQRVSNLVKSSSEKTFVIHAPVGDYTVGYQLFTSGVGYELQHGLDISFNTMTDKTIILKSDGANFKIRDGQHYGVFDKNTQAVFNTTMPFYPGTPSWTADGEKVAIAHNGYQFNFDNIKGFMLNGSLNIDGNMQNTIIGGQYGDNGWQLAAIGFRLSRVENFSISNITTRNNCLDGIYISGVCSETQPNIPNQNYAGTIRSVISQGNGRQGCSFTGGQNISWYDCSFFDTALSGFKVQSAPASSFDIEAEIYPIRFAKFYNCYFGDSNQNSFVADTGDSRDVEFYSCRFINSIGPTCWVRKPEFKFNDCYFNGYQEGQYGTLVNEDRTVYNNCIFTDDPSVNPNYVAGLRPLIDSSGANPIYNDCNIRLYKSGLPSSSGFNGNVGLVTEYNNLIIDVHGTNEQSSMFGVMTVRIRDNRPVRTLWVPTIGSTTESSLIVENLTGAANQIAPTGYSGYSRVATQIVSPYIGYQRI